MNIDQLIKMANEIGCFWEGETGAQAANDVATHLRRYWEPRMRAQIISYYEQRQGAGLSDIARQAVAILAEAKATAQPGSTGAPAHGPAGSTGDHLG